MTEPSEFPPQTYGSPYPPQPYPAPYPAPYESPYASSYRDQQDPQYPSYEPQPGYAASEPQYHESQEYPQYPQGDEYPQYPQYAPPRSRSRRNSAGVVTAAVVGALVLLVGGGFAIQKIKDHRVYGPRRTLVVPERVDEYQHLTNARAQDLEFAARGAMSSAAHQQAAIFDRALIALYGTDPAATRPDFVFVGTNSRDNAPARVLFSRASPAENARAFLDGAHFTGVDSYDDGPLDGVLRCGTTLSAGRTVAGCVWFDRSTFGFVLTFTDSSPAQLAGLTRDLRAQSEH